MARKKSRKTYEERAAREGGRLPPGAPPPERDPHLGKPAVRYVYERFYGTLESDEEDPSRVALQPSGRRRRMIPLEKLFEVLQPYEGFQVELTVFKDHDPDVAFRMGEAVEGWGGSMVWDGGSVYVARLGQELELLELDREYEVSLAEESLVVSVDGEPTYRLTSPGLGFWILELKRDGRWRGVESGLTFLEALEGVLFKERLSA